MVLPFKVDISFPGIRVLNVLVVLLPLVVIKDEITGSKVFFFNVGNTVLSNVVLSLSADTFGLETVVKVLDKADINETKLEEGLLVTLLVDNPAV